jgi:hypothetical protein
MKKYTDKSIEKRREDRYGYADFYKKHVDIIKNNKVCCYECGIKLLGDVSEVAHVLNKSNFKSIATNDENIIYLCGWKQNNCHDKFDSGKEREMKVYQIAKDKFNILKELIKEKINYKIWEKYGG